MVRWLEPKLMVPEKPDLVRRRAETAGLRKFDPDGWAQVAELGAFAMQSREGAMSDARTRDSHLEVPDFESVGAGCGAFPAMD